MLRAVLAAALLFAATDAVAAASPTTVVRVEIAPMSDEAFWAIIAQTTPFEADPEAQTEALRAALGGLSAEQLVAFDSTFHRQMARAYTWDLWAVAFIAHGGASDDGFEYFRRWMISKGQAVFERLLAHPDDLADLVAEDSEGLLEFEGFPYVIGDVWSEKTGASFADMPVPAAALMMGVEPAGEPFSADGDELAARFPKTWARFGRRPLG